MSCIYFISTVKIYLLIKDLITVTYIASLEILSTAKAFNLLLHFNGSSRISSITSRPKHLMIVVEP